MSVTAPLCSGPAQTELHSAQQPAAASPAGAPLSSALLLPPHVTPLPSQTHTNWPQVTETRQTLGNLKSTGMWASFSRHLDIY